MLSLMFFGAPLAYAALNLYLLAKIQPLPIMFLPDPANDRSESRERVSA